jgi:hypothetical protein
MNIVPYRAGDSPHYGLVQNCGGYRSQRREHVPQPVVLNLAQAQVTETRKISNSPQLCYGAERDWSELLESCAYLRALHRQETDLPSRKYKQKIKRKLKIIITSQGLVRTK